MPQDREIDIQWVVEESEAQALQKSMEAEGSVKSATFWEPDADTMEEFGDSQIEPFVIIAGIVATGWLIKRLSDVFLDWKRGGGMLIDATGEVVAIRPAPLAKRGHLIFMTKNGVKPSVFGPKERDQALDLLSAFLNR